MPRHRLFEIPAEVKAVLQAQGLETPDCVCVCSQLTFQADFGRAWLAINAQRLCTIEQQEKPRVMFAADLASLKAARALPFLGGGAMAVECGGKTVEILRFPASQSTLFGALVSTLDKELKDGKDGGGAPAQHGKPAMLEAMRTAIDKELRLHCPQCGRRFEKNSEVCPYCLNRRRILFRVLGFTKQYRRKLALISLLMVLGTALLVLPPIILGKLTDQVLIHGDLGALPLLLGELAAIMVGTHALTILRARLAIWVGGQVTHSIRMLAYSHLQGLSMSYFDKQQTGALMNRVANDTRELEGFLVEGIQFTIISLLQVVAIAAILIVKNPLLGCLVLLPAPLVVVLSKLVWKRVFYYFRKTWDSRSRMTAYLSDSLAGVREIKSTGQELRTISAFEERSGDVALRTIRAEQTWQTLIPVLSLVIQTSTLLVWYFGARQVVGQSMTVGQLTAYLGLMGLLFGPLQMITRLNDWLARSLTAAERVFEVIDTRAEVTEAHHALALPHTRGYLELKNVVFGYEKHKPVIKNISFTAGAGEMIGLVGRSGAGKSSLAKLLMRLYDPDEGAILIDGLDIRQLRREDLCRQVGVVLQEPFLFNGSVAENIAFARPRASLHEIMRAAIAANAHEFILKLPNGYDSHVGERGAKLSGGERQRIAIARALISDPKILILDEATSSVDTETEQKIQQALERLVKGRTTVAIAHRLSTLRFASRLVVLEEGELKETGTHDELMAKTDGIYHKLVTIQTDWAKTIAVGT